MGLAAEGNHSLLEGLGIQRESTSGTWVNAQTSIWHEVLDVAGDGAISLRLNRAVGDAGGQAIGEYRTNLGQEDLLELVQLVHDTAWEDFKLTRPLKPTNVKIIFRLVIDGHRWEKVVGVAPPPAMDSIQAALQKFDAVAIALRKSPASTLGLTLALPKTIQEDTQRLEVGLEFEGGRELRIVGTDSGDNRHHDHVNKGCERVETQAALNQAIERACRELSAQARGAWRWLPPPTQFLPPAPPGPWITLQGESLYYMSSCLCAPALALGVGRTPRAACIL